MPVSAAVNRLWLPRASLTTCLRGVMTRSTLGVPLSAGDRFSHFPASPLCSLGWYFEGRGDMLEPSAAPGPQAARQPLPGPHTFSGPHNRPSVFWNPGPVHGMMALLLPDAVQRLLGLDLAEWVNRHAAVSTVLPPDWVAMCETLPTLPDDAARVTYLEDFLEPRWEAVRPRRAGSAHRYHDWAQSLALRAATSGPGKSLRQVERRIKLWAGLPMRELRGFSRSERAFFHTLMHESDGAHPPWADVADAAGYADQSHLCRETRRITGHAPEALYRLIQDEEPYWSYRIWQ